MSGAIARDIRDKPAYGECGRQWCGERLSVVLLVPRSALQDRIGSNPGCRSSSPRQGPNTCPFFGYSAFSDRSRFVSSWKLLDSNCRVSILRNETTPEICSDGNSDQVWFSSARSPS